MVMNHDEFDDKGVPAYRTEDYRGYWENEYGEGYVVRQPDEHDAGDFEVGDKVRLTNEALSTRHVGATGTVVRVETVGEDGDPLIFPIVVWLDTFGQATKPEIETGMGLALCAKEIERV